MTKVRDLLLVKGSDVWSIGPAQSVYQAIEMMALKGVGALTVVNSAGELIGIISERDYARKVILKNRSSRDTRVEEIMTRDLITVQEETGIGDCMELMTRYKVRHLPVMTGDKLTGIISVGDVVRQIIDEQSHEIEHLERYIRGGPQA